MLRKRNDYGDMLRKDNNKSHLMSPELLLWLARACERRLDRDKAQQKDSHAKESRQAQGSAR
jgi:hypothetical protein